MPLFSIIGKDRPDGLAHRQAVRPRHLAHLQSLGRTLVFAGALQDDSGRATGSFVVVEADDADAARALFEADPYILEGVFAQYEINRFAIAFNNSEGR
jgi:uncharacterized protein YciI